MLSAALHTRHCLLASRTSLSCYAHMRALSSVSHTRPTTPVSQNRHSSELLCLSTSHRLLKHSLLPGLSSAVIRFNSTSTPEAPSLPEGYIPEPPPIPTTTPVLDDQVLTSLGEPTLSSLGLCNYTPPGFVQWCLEQIHVGLDIPWWGAIVICTVILRVCISPLVIIARRNTANMHNHTPVLQKLQARITKARNSGDQIQMMRVAYELQDYMKRNNINFLKNLLLPLSQAPIFISMFLGLRRMANLPVESLQTGGLLWITDLTMPDPIFVVPIVTMATLLVTFEIGADGIKSGTMTHTMKWVMRGMPLVMLPFIVNFPSALLVYWFSTNLISLAQVAVLSRPSVRAYFKIPELVDHNKSSVQLQKKGFVEGFKDSWTNAKTQARVEDRMRADAMKFKQAGIDPVQKTYSYDPTKVKQAKKL